MSPQRIPATADAQIGLYRSMDDRYYEARALTSLGDAQQAAGQRDAAHQTWWRAERILTDLDHPEVDRVRGRLRTIDIATRPDRPG